MTSSPNTVSSLLHLEDTEIIEDDKPCGQDVYQLTSTVATLLSSGDADMACVLFDPLGKVSSESSSSGALGVKMGSIQHSLLLLGNVALIARFLKTVVGHVLVHTTQDSLEALVGKALRCYFASDLNEFFKVYRKIAESLQKSISIMVEKVDEGERHTMLLVAEYLKDTEPDMKKIDHLKNELKKRVTSEMVTVADARAIATIALKAMETSVEKVSTDQKHVKVTLHCHQEQLLCQRQEINDLKCRLEVQEKLHSRELKNQEERHRQDMRDCKEDIMKQVREELNRTTLLAEEREKEMVQRIQKLQNTIEEQATELGQQKIQQENLQREYDERVQQLREANEKYSKLEGGYKQARRSKLVYKVVGGICVVAVCTLAGGLIGLLLGPVGGVIGAEFGAAIGVGIAAGAVFGAGVCLTVEGGGWLLNRN